MTALAFSTGPAVARTLRLAGRTVRVEAPPAWLAAVLGPLDVFAAADAAGEGAPSVGIVLRAVVDEGPAACDPSAGLSPAGPSVVYLPPPQVPAVVARGSGRAYFLPDGSIRVRLATGDEGPPPADDSLAERLVLPALAERLRRDGVLLVHAAALLPVPADRDGGGATPTSTAGPGSRPRAWLVPAARGGGKSTLSLSLRGRGFTLLSDDRGWLYGDAAEPRFDPFPEAPRVGDRSLFLLPPLAAAGPRDARTGKAPVPGLTPPRLASPVGVRGVIVPRLVDGPGGDVRPLRGARALAALVSQALVVTDEAAAAPALAFLADLLSRVPAYEATVGHDPGGLARAVAAVSETPGGRAASNS